MKKVLLGSTALVAAGLMAGPAFAQLELSISGSVDFHVGIADEDEVAGTDNRGYGMTTDTTLNFNADGVADNGLEYGTRINVDDQDLSDTAGDGQSGFEIDETYVYIRGSFGEFRLGEDDPAASTLRFAVPAVGNGQADGDFERYVGRGANDATSFGTDFAYSSDDTKVIYIGTFGDFTVGASFSPTADARLSDPAIIEEDEELADIFSVGGNYQGSFNNVSVGVSAGVQFGDIEGVGANSGGDHEEFGVGAEVGFGAVTVGGFYIDSEQDDEFGVTQLERIRYGIGATFSTGPWSFGANALLAEDDNAAGGADDEEDEVYGIGVEYALADGLTPYADLVIFDFDNAGTANDNDGSAFLVGVTASF